MQLAAATRALNVGLEDAVGEALDRRLRRESPRPIALALSGGGDSLALALIAAAWARRAGRPLRVLTVDHRLRPESAAWTEACAATAARLGAGFQALAWTGEKPSSGLPAAARAARHALLADAAREAGARVILMGHTADDVLEAAAMREAGSTTPAPRDWAPSPAWPQGRGVFLLRPMLRVRRADIRQWLAGRGEHWIDDPANTDRAYARARARQALSSSALPPEDAPGAAANALALACRADARGGLEIDREALRDAEPQARARFVSAACLCAAGTDRPPGREKVERLARRLAGAEDFTASLAGARVTGEGPLASFRREPGEAARGGLAPLTLANGEARVWDGRYEIVADRVLEVRPLRRTGLPMVADGGALRTSSLILGRLLAACGAVEREPG
ncbi:MAG: tRNA lysidine(34) synthetase TilS [Phenylobacterium sp.]